MSKLSKSLIELRSKMAAAAQDVYSEWDQDGEGFDADVGGGGICDRVSQAIADVVGNSVDDVEIFDGGQEGDDHAWLIVQGNGEAFGVDIPPQVYEFGAGYNWKKKKNVKFTPDHVVIFPVPLVEGED